MIVSSSGTNSPGAPTFGDLDHGITDQSSIIAIIEDNWILNVSAIILLTQKQVQ
jgi:hypothetical protein